MKRRVGVAMIFSWRTKLRRRPEAASLPARRPPRGSFDLLLDLETVGGRLARALVGHHLVGNLLALVQAVQTGALNRADVNKYVRPAGGRLNEAEALLGVEPFHSTCSHSVSS